MSYNCVNSELTICIYFLFQSCNNTDVHAKTPRRKSASVHIMYQVLYYKCVCFYVYNKQRTNEDQESRWRKKYLLVGHRHLFIYF